MSSAVAENIYFTATGEQEGKPVIYRNMQSVPKGEKETDFPTLINIYWPFEKKENNGMPDRNTNKKQIVFEDAIAPLDVNGVSHLMMVVTGNGRKEWIWYVRDSDEWMEKLNELLVGHDVYPIQIEMENDPEWSTYYNFVSDVKVK
ncbi:DUF695 domain-containing protein [Microbulbifer sp. MLAF003]|uniref:DUF695 domain-containing protein n=1 Tax=Microbulbifer sp. MLAF003 TaxID=3032582 RepID=UPI0024AC9185|nr:DUF695 domain-containing protein [Microbulbifer sp. MLAF003]WHI52925.1 DUF695 domain-containing protein [Microbulbifer sp. MLAF003]